MLDVRTFRSRPQFHYLFLLLFALSISVTAQDKDVNKEKGKEKQSKKADAVGSGNFVKVEGKVRCDKPEPEHAIEVPDRPGHALMISKRKCNWTEPMVVMGGKTKDGVSVSFTEKMEGTLHTHGFEVDTLDNGEKLTWQSMGQVLAEKGPATAKGRWSLMRGTGKFKGATGKLKAIGEVDFNDGQVGLRYSGRVCFATSDDDKDAAAVTHSNPGVAANVAVPAVQVRPVSNVVLARERRRLAHL